MSKKLFRAVGKIAGIVATVASFIPGGQLIAVAAGAIAVGASMLVRPKAPPISPASTDRLQANIDPRTPRKFVFGRTAMATDIRDQELSDGQDFLHRFIVCTSHKVGSIEEIWFDDKLAWSQSGGIAGEFVGYLNLDACTEGTPADVINISPRMGSSRRYTGLAWLYMGFKLTGDTKKAESPFAQSVPSRVTIVGNGAYVYDPRLDSTVPGGSGSCRANNQATWIWDDNAARNPALQLLWYLLGWRIQNPSTGEWRLAVGKGIPPARIDLASFITAANLCDEPVTLAAGGTQPRYRSDGLFSEGDATSVVLDQLKASMNAELDDVDGKIRITVLHNDLSTPVADFTEDDILTGYSWEQTAPLDETYNVVRGTYIDPSNNSLYQAVDYPEVRIDSPDGIDRVETVDFQTVQDDRQAQRLVKQRVARMLYSGRFTATFSYRAWKVQKNDVIRLTFSPLGWTNKLFRVIETAVQVDGRVPMVLQVENEDIYLWDADERPAIQPVEPTSYDPFLNPIYQDVVDPKYGDGTSINDLRPYEAGATNGATDEQAAAIAAPTVTITRPTVMLWAYENGLVLSFANANGQLKVWSAGVDVTASATLSAGATNCTGTINTATNSPVSGKPKGWYQVTAMSANDATLTLTAVYNGTTLTAQFNLTKQRGGYEIVTALPTTNLFPGRVVSYDGRLWQNRDGVLDGWAPMVDVTNVGVGANMLAGAIPGANPGRYLYFDNHDGIGYYNGGYGPFLSPAWGTGWPGAAWTLPDNGTFGVYQNNASTGATGFSTIYLSRVIDVSGGSTLLYPVEAGKTYEFSIYTGAKTCLVEVFIIWLDAAMAGVGATVGAIDNDDDFEGGSSLNQYKRLYARGEAPAGTAFARLMMRKHHTKPGGTDSWMFGVYPMFGETSTNPIDLLPWNMPGYSILHAEVIAAGTVVTDKLAASSVTAAKMNVTQLSAITAVIGTLRTATTGGRQEIYDNVLKTFDASNVKRVQLGDLSL